jgi:DnaK suppressor protein
VERREEVYAEWRRQAALVTAIREGTGDGTDDDAGAADTRTRQVHRLDELRAHLDDIDEAVSRIDAGVYGVCGDCGKAIPAERLALFPTAKLCVRCKGRRER